MKRLYDADFYEWTRRNAALLRSRRFEEADVEHIADEIEDMGKRDRRELRILLGRLIQALMRLAASPGAAVLDEIDAFRAQLQDIVEDSPSLGNALAEELPKAWQAGETAGCPAWIGSG